MDHLRQSGLALLLVAGGALCAWSAHAVDCPADETHPDWPETETPTGTMAELASGYCAPATAHVGTGINTTTYNTPEAFRARLQVIQPTFTDVLVFISPTHGAPPSVDYCVTWKTSGGANRGTYLRVHATADDCTPEEPPDPEECVIPANTQGQGYAENQLIATFVPPATGCAGGEGYGNCAWFRKAEYSNGSPLGWSRTRDSPTHATYWWRVQFTGLTCEEAGDDVEDYTEAGERCSGSWCESVGNEPGCGFLNGEYVCPDEFDRGDCYKHASGSVTCHSDSPTPPVPDNGTPGEPADPDHSVDVCTGASSCQTVNNYDNETVDGSSRPVPDGSGPGGSGPIGPGTGGTGGGPGSGSGGLGDGDGEEGDDDSASGGLTCEAAPTCDGDPIQCVLLYQQWKTRCPDAPTEGEALDAIGATSEEMGSGTGIEVDVGELNGDGPISVGDCPAPLSVSIMGESLSLDIWQAGCDMAVLFAPIVMLLSYLAAAFLLIKGSG